MILQTTLVLLLVSLQAVSSCLIYVLQSGEYCSLVANKFQTTIDQIIDLDDGNKTCAQSRQWVDDNLQVCGGTTGSPPPPPPPPPPQGICSILTELSYDSMFPNRNARYSYANLISASQRAFADGFCSSSNNTANRRELAAFLAHTSHETGDFFYVCENCNPTNCGPCNTNYNYGGNSSFQYYGRGALQLSWNYNYQAVGSVLGEDFISNPGLVATAADYIWSTALWFWMLDNNGACHSASQSGNFAQTITTINGGIECGQAPGTIGNEEMQDRVSRYQKYCSQFGVDPGSLLTC